MRPHCSTCKRSHKHTLRTSPNSGALLTCDYEEGSGGGGNGSGNGANATERPASSSGAGPSAGEGSGISRGGRVEHEHSPASGDEDQGHEQARKKRKSGAAGTGEGRKKKESEADKLRKKIGTSLIYPKRMDESHRGGLHAGAGALPADLSGVEGIVQVGEVGIASPDRWRPTGRQAA